MLQPCFHPVVDIPATARELAQLARLFLHCGMPLTALVQVSCITTLLQLVNNWQLTRLFFFLPGANVVILILSQNLHFRQQQFNFYTLGLSYYQNIIFYNFISIKDKSSSFLRHNIILKS